MAKDQEEAEILWKLGRKTEALTLIDTLLSKNPEDATLLELAATFYMDAKRLKDARRCLDRLAAMNGETDNVLRLRGSLWILDGKWNDAQKIYRELYQKSPNSLDVEKTYAEILSIREKWRDAREVYKSFVAKKQYKQDDLWNYKMAIEAGAPQIGTYFIYKHRPQTQRDYILGQNGSFWANPWLRVGIGMNEERYRMSGQGDNETVNRLILSHFFEGTLHHSNAASLKAKWIPTYYRHDMINEMDWLGHLEKGIWQSDWECDWNQQVRDPIDGIDKEGKRDMLRMNHRLTFWNRLETGDELMTEWYRMNGDKNIINGAGHLGYKISNDAYVNLVLLRKPYLAINYRYREGHWHEKFEFADQVLGFLPREQAHMGGLYAEQKVGSFLNLSAAITRGSDRKRHVDFIYWYFKGALWVTNYMKLSFAFEYDYGDSGTGGRGNSQIMTTTADIYLP